MRHVKITAFDLPDAWFQGLERIWEEGEYFTVKYGSEITGTKKLDVTFEILHPENKPLVHEKAPCDMHYVMNYFMEYLWFAGRRPDKTTCASTFIKSKKRIPAHEKGIHSNSDRYISLDQYLWFVESYTYSSRLRSPVDQIETAINRYADELFDRQVTLVLRIPEDILKKFEGKRHEPPCLTILDTEITRDESDKKLRFTLVGYWRSWDAFGALPANLAGLQLFSEAFVKEINARGIEKHKDDWEEVYTGKMIMHSKNCHIYKRQFPMVEELLRPRKSTFGESPHINKGI